MFEWEAHIEPMIDACQNAREEALVALLWDLGPRTSELHDLRVGNITDREQGYREREERHPLADDRPLGPIRPGLDGATSGRRRRLPLESAGPTRTRLPQPPPRCAQEVAHRADIDQPATPTRMRKSSASYLASQNVNQAFLEDHHGWVRGSDKAARYIAVFGDASDRAIAAAHGVDVEPDRDDPEMIRWVR